MPFFSIKFDSYHYKNLLLIEKKIVSKSQLNLKKRTALRSLEIDLSKKAVITILRRTAQNFIFSIIDLEERWNYLLHLYFIR